MDILVGCKIVPEEQDVGINSDGSLDMSRASSKISPFDLSALQAAVDIRELTDDVNIKVLSIGGKNLENSKIQKDILSRGADELFIVADEKFQNLLPHDTAEIFKLAAQSIGFDLIICADGSADLFAGQVGIKAGALLDIPVVNSISKIVSIDSANSKIIVQRELETEIEELEISLPALICVTTDINTPTIPGMKAILAASKKPVNEINLVYEPNDCVLLKEVKAPKKKDRLGIITEGDGDDKIAEFVSNFKKALN